MKWYHLTRTLTLSGIACMVTAAWWIHPIAGMMLLGAWLIAISIAIGEGK